MINYSRLPFLLLAILGLTIGLAAGLSRLGWDLSIPKTSFHHGAIMVGGFMGTLISLEKIIPLKNKFLYMIPLLSGTSVIIFFTAVPQMSLLMLSLAAVGLATVFVYYLTKEKTVIYALMAGGAICWLTGNLILLTSGNYPAAFSWWLAFILFIITAERLELAKFLPVSNRRKVLLLVFLMLYLIGILVSFHAGGQRVSGASLIAIALWLMKYDIVGISVRKRGLQKFIGIALLSGYMSLMLTGVFMLALSHHVMGYDAVIHTFFMGFGFSMIFAHGPVILPGVLGISAKPWHVALCFWLFILHISWIMRVATDVTVDFQLRRISGIISVVAIAGYFLTIAILTITTTRRNAKVL